MAHEKIALVTGASAGICKACALALIKAGFTVVLTARRKDKLDEAMDRAVKRLLECGQLAITKLVSTSAHSQ